MNFDKKVLARILALCFCMALLPLPAAAQPAADLPPAGSFLEIDGWRYDVSGVRDAPLSGPGWRYAYQPPSPDSPHRYSLDISEGYSGAPIRIPNSSNVQVDGGVDITGTEGKPALEVDGDLALCINYRATLTLIGGAGAPGLVVHGKLSRNSSRYWPYCTLIGGSADQPALTFESLGASVPMVYRLSESGDFLDLHHYQGEPKIIFSTLVIQVKSKPLPVVNAPPIWGDKVFVGWCSPFHDDNLWPLPGETVYPGSFYPIPNVHDFRLEPCYSPYFEASGHVTLPEPPPGEKDFVGWLMFPHKQTGLGVQPNSKWFMPGDVADAGDGAYFVRFSFRESLVYHGNGGVNTTGSDSEYVVTTHVSSGDLITIDPPFQKPDHIFTGYLNQSQQPHTALQPGSDAIDSVIGEYDYTPQHLYCQWAPAPAFRPSEGASVIYTDSREIRVELTSDWFAAQNAKRALCGLYLTSGKMIDICILENQPGTGASHTFTYSGETPLCRVFLLDQDWRPLRSPYFCDPRKPSLP